MVNVQNVHSFSKLVSRWKPAVRSLIRTYAAVRSENGWLLRYGLLSFSPELPIPKDKHLFVATKSIRAGIDAIAIMPCEIDKFIESVAAGNFGLSVGGEDLIFGGGETDSSFNPSRPPRASFSRRLPCLTITTRNNVSLIDRPEDLDLDMKAHDQPFDGVQDLLSTLGIPVDPRYNSNSIIEIVLPTPAMIVDESQIISEKLSIKIKASPNIAPNVIRIGVRAHTENGQVRFTLREDKIIWDQVGDWLYGSCVHPLPNVSHAQCFLNYGEDFLHSWWIVDPTKALNKRVGVYTLFDQDKQALRELLYPERSRSRDIESGIAQLMSLHGFIVGKIGRRSDAPDVLAETPSGKLLVIECTTDLPDKGDKLSKLIQRTIKIAEYVSKNSGSYLDIQAVLATSLTEAESGPHRDLAIKHKVALVCKEQIEELLNRLDVPENPDQIFEEAKQLAEQDQGELFNNGLGA